MIKKVSKWREFQLARSWARSLGIKSELDWRRYRKDYKLPEDIPSNPDREYKKLSVWNNWSDFLGTGNLKYNEIVRRTYLEAQKWAINQGIKSQKEWRLSVQSPDFPSDIYKAPDRGYEEFTTWPEFLQNFTRLNIRNQRKRSYKDTKKWARSVPVISSNHWKFLAKQNLIPLDIPTNVHTVYKDFRGWSDFLGNKIKGKASLKETVLALELSHFLSVKTQEKIDFENREKSVDLIVKDQKLIIEYDGYHWHKNSHDADLLFTNEMKKNGWMVLRVREGPLKKLSDLDLIISSKISEIEVCKLAVQHLLDKGLIKAKSKKILAEEYLSHPNFIVLKDDLLSLKWMSFEEAHREVLKMNIGSETEWRQIKSTLFPNIPRNPNEVYFVNWKDWGHWLGTGNKANPNDHLPFEEAREYVRSLGLKDSREYRTFLKNNPNVKLPHNPQELKAYEGKFRTWMDWLGTEKTAYRKREWPSFEDAVEKVRSLGLTSEMEWRKLKKSDKFPVELPRAPEQKYKNEWKGWPYFLRGD